MLLASPKEIHHLCKDFNKKGGHRMTPVTIYTPYMDMYIHLHMYTGILHICEYTDIYVYIEPYVHPQSEPYTTASMT